MKTPYLLETHVNYLLMNYVGALFESGATGIRMGGIVDETRMGMKRKFQDRIYSILCLKKATKCIGVYIQKTFGRKKVYADISVENRWGGMGEKEEFLTFCFTAFGLNYFF